MPKLHVDEVYPMGKIYPMIINFQNGYTTDQFKPEVCCVFKDKDSDKIHIATEINDLIYAGNEVKEDLGKTFILARNKTTGKVRLIEVGRAELNPVLNDNSDVSELLETSNLELSRKFGSKKHKQREEQREKLKVNVETVTQQMQNVTETISEDKLDLSVYNKNDSDDFYVPIMDKMANKPENVYEIDKMLTEQQYEKIYSELEGKDYMSDMLPWIQSIVSTKKDPKHIVLGVFANTLLKLFLLFVKDISKKTFVACPYSATLNALVISNFLYTNTVTTRRSRPPQYKDKALCHAIVYLLLINNLKIDLESLTSSIKVTPATASLKARVTGASVIVSGGKKVVQLKLPLSTKPGLRRKSAKF